jgi:hypothetical protein
MTSSGTTVRSKLQWRLLVESVRAHGCGACLEVIPSAFLSTVGMPLKQGRSVLLSEKMCKIFKCNHECQPWLGLRASQVFFSKHASTKTLKRRTTQKPQRVWCRLTPCCHNVNMVMILAILFNSQCPCCHHVQLQTTGQLCSQRNKETFHIRIV